MRTPPISSLHTTAEAESDESDCLRGMAFLPNVGQHRRRPRGAPDISSVDQHLARADALMYADKKAKPTAELAA